MSIKDGLWGWGLEDLVLPRECFPECIIDKLPSNLKAALPFGWLLDDGTFIVTRDIWTDKKGD